MIACCSWHVSENVIKIIKIDSDETIKECCKSHPAKLLTIIFSKPQFLQREKHVGCNSHSFETATFASSQIWI